MLVEALIEREIRASMRAEELAGIPLYPEFRNCPAPSATRILEIFSDVQRHRLMSGDAEVVDELTSETELRVGSDHDPGPTIGSPFPDHHSHSVFLMRPAGLGTCSTSTRMMLPLTIGGSSQSRHRPGHAASGAGCARRSPSRFRSGGRG
jgi:hypothetical protein